MHHQDLADPGRGGESPLGNVSILISDLALAKSPGQGKSGGSGYEKVSFGFQGACSASF